MCCLYLLRLHVYERLYYCTVQKNNHNAEKAFSITIFGFSILFVFYLFVFFLFIIQLTKSTKKAFSTSLLYSICFLFIYYIIKKIKTLLRLGCLGQSRKRSVRVIWYLFGMAPQGVVHLQNASFWRAHKFELASLGILVQCQLWSCRQTSVPWIWCERLLVASVTWWREG